jgi:hypothetical protein
METTQQPESEVTTEPELTAGASPEAPVESEAPAAPETKAEAPAAAADSADTAPVNTLEGDRINIMENLVKANSDRYIEIMGVCTCPRCKVDVETIALNNLPPKYVFMKPNEISARSTVYAGRFQTAVTAQLMRACQTVLDNPRHDQ